MVFRCDGYDDDADDDDDVDDDDDDDEMAMTTTTTTTTTATRMPTLMRLLCLAQDLLPLLVGHSLEVCLMQLLERADVDDISPFR
jgi:hypothetical protein